MCNEIAHFTLTLIKLFVYAVENELYTLAEVGFSILQASSDEFATFPKDYFYFFFFVLLHVTQ